MNELEEFAAEVISIMQRRGESELARHRFALASFREALATTQCYVNALVSGVARDIASEEELAIAWGCTAQRAAGEKNLFAPTCGEIAALWQRSDLPVGAEEAARAILNWLAAKFIQFPN